MSNSRLATTRRLAERAQGGDLAALRELCAHLGIPYRENLPASKLPEGVAEKLDVGWARKNRLVPFAAGDDHVVVATSRPMVLDAVDELSFILGQRVELVGAPEEEVLAALNFLFSESMDSADDMLRELAETGQDPMSADLDAVPDLIDSSEAAPVIRLVNRVLFQAVSERASDVHIEPGADRVKVRYRIDGVLYDRLAPAKGYLPFLVSRVKVMAGLDIAEKRLPQDGRFQFTVAEKNIDVRVSVIPTAGGERVV